MTETPIFQNEPAVLRRLLVRMRAAQERTSWEGLRRSGEDAAAAAAYFLLDVEPDGGPEGGVEHFVTYTLGRLMQQLSRSTQQRRVEYRGQVRGRIVWPATIKARYSGDYDPTRFVCREVLHQYDTPENQLLRYVVDRIGVCLKMVPETLRSGTCYCVSAEALDPHSTAARLGRMETVFGRLRRYVRLWEVTLPEQINELHLARANTSRITEYADVARLYGQYQRVVASSSWDVVAAIGNRMLLLPGDPGSRGDPWIQLGADLLRAPQRSEYG